MESMIELRFRKMSSLRWRLVVALVLSLLLTAAPLGFGGGARAWGDEGIGGGSGDVGNGDGETGGDEGDVAGDDGPIWADAPDARTPEERISFLRGVAEEGSVSIHVMAFMGCDAILLESDGRFGLVDAGEDNDYPDNSDLRYPLRDGVVRGGGHEDELVAYMRECGVTSENLDFVLGTHPHSDHIGALDEVIYEFSPARVYLMEYEDSFVTNPAALWDNLYVYDHVVEAVQSTGIAFVQFFDRNAPVVPPSGDDPERPTDPEEPGEGEGDLSAMFAMMAPEELSSRFSADPTDNAWDPNNDGTVPGGAVAVLLSDDPDEILGKKDSERTGNPVFMLGSALVEVMNYSDDYKFEPKPDANYFSLGVKVSAGGRSAFLSGDINNYDGDESRLAGAVGHVDFLKIGHHGYGGSSTSEYLRALAPLVTMQTSGFENTNGTLLDDLLHLGFRHYTSADLIERGIAALKVTFADGRMAVNVPTESYHVRARSSSPHYYMFRDFAPRRYSGVFDDEGRKYFFKNSFMALENAWYTDASGTYRLDGDGLPLTGVRQVGDDLYRFDDKTGTMLRGPRWLDEGGNRFWVTGDGSFARGWQQVDGKWYWFDSRTRAMATGLVEVAGELYLLGEDGVMASNGWVQVGDRRCWATSSGALARGWRYVDGKWYWLDPQTCGLVTGWYKVEGEWNWSDASGVWHENEWRRDDDGWWYAWADGTYPTDSWQLIGGKWYRFDELGYMQTGWRRLSGSWYYLQESGAMATGWHRVDGTWYYLGDSPDDGAMRTGWQKVSGSWYLLEGGGAMATGWQHVGGRWYLLTSSGAMATGWQYVDGAWYYLGDSPDDGAMATGWRLVDGAWYYLEPSGAMASDRWVGDYYVGPSGAMVVDAWVDGYYVDESGRWDPRR